MNDWINELPNDTVISTALKGDTMETTGTRINQQPELYLAADVEPFAKGGWKTTVKASVRVYDGSEGMLYAKLEALLDSGLALAHNAIQNYEEATKKEAGDE